MKLYKILFLSFLVTLLFTACEEGLNDKFFRGVPQVEFAKSIAGENQTFLLTSSGQVETFGVMVQLIGEPQAQDITVSYQIEASSTAEEGVHFNDLSGGSVVIPAGSNSASVQFESELDNFTSDIAVPFSIDLTISSADVKIAENVKSVSVGLIVACPYNASEIVGTYEVVADPFGAGLVSTVEVVAGPGANQYTILDIFGHGEETGAPEGSYDVVVDIDPSDGSTSGVAAQDAWDSSVFALDLGIARVDGGGTTFSCIGSIDLSFEHRVEAGTYGGGPYIYSLRKL